MNFDPGSRKWMGRAGSAALLLTLTLAACAPRSTPGLGDSSEVPKPAPEFSLPDLSGKTIRLSDSAGQVRLIDFWATWCPPCREAIPDLNEMYADYEKDGFVVIGISMDDDAKKSLPAFLEKYKIRYPMLIGNDEVAEAFGGVFGLPTSFLVDREGRIIKTWIGGTPKPVIEKQVRSLLGLAPKA